MAKYEVVIGDDFIVRGVKVHNIVDVLRLAELDEKRRKSRTHDRIVGTILGAGFAALASAAGVGLWDGSYNELDTIWGYVSWPMGMALYPVLGKGINAYNGKIKQ